MEEKKGFRINLFTIIMLLILVGIIACVCHYVITNSSDNLTYAENQKTEKVVVPAKTTSLKSKIEYTLENNKFSQFDLSFLKYENQKENKVYSPLSIKYAFKMLEEATIGKAHDQIAEIVQAYNLTKYKSNENMSLANAFFIRDSFKDSVKEDYIELLKTKYDAEVEFDSFDSSEKINDWVSKNTLNLIPRFIEDYELENLDFALINALGIDMEWKHKFLEHDYEDDKNIVFETFYYHEKLQGDPWGFAWMVEDELFNKKFDNNQNVSSMYVVASLNNYDIVKELGKDKIRETVYQDFRDWALGEGTHTSEYDNGRDEAIFKGDYSEEGIKKAFEDYFDRGITSYDYDRDGKLYSSFKPVNTEDGYYIDGLNKNKGKVDYTTDFSIYVDDDVKVFAKDLKEYDGTTLQYIGIMPINEELDKFIEHTQNTDIINLVSKLKELKRENFKDGYLTYIHGYIPKFSFEYELQLKDDLANMGVTDVFGEGTANLTNLTDDESIYIQSAKHVANIDFSQDGIKAAAATMAGGGGGGDWYDYYFEMPTEEIDITFDKPYMFLIRDKKTNETWFVGTVYEPLDVNDETGYELTVAWEDREELDY